MIPPSGLQLPLSKIVGYVGIKLIIAPTIQAGESLVYSISPSLPSGFNFNTTNGQITGSSDVENNGTDYTITASNYSGSVSASFKMIINPKENVITMGGKIGDVITSRALQES